MNLQQIPAIWPRLNRFEDFLTDLNWMSAMDMDMVLDQKFFAEINQPPFKIAMDIVRHPISVQKTDNPIGFCRFC
jgi:hypothetical protein